MLLPVEVVGDAASDFLTSVEAVGGCAGAGMLVEAVAGFVVVVVVEPEPEVNASAETGLENLVSEVVSTLDNRSCGVIISEDEPSSGGGGICIQLYWRFSTGIPYFPASIN